MEITERIIDDISVIVISGRVDMITSRDLEAVLNKTMDTYSRVVVDLSDTDYLSSSGLRVLLAALKRLKGKKGNLGLASPQLVVRNILDISGLSNLFSIHHNLADAVHSLQSKQ